MGIEIERKFLVDHLPDVLPDPIEICQGYLSDQADRVVRVRSSTGPSGGQGFLTIKGRTRGRVRQEFEYSIPLDDAHKLFDLCMPPLVEKDRFLIEYQGHCWELDRFKGVNQGLMVAEIELTHPDQPVPLPPWVGAEVTDDPRYFNANLISNPFTTW